MTRKERRAARKPTLNATSDRSAVVGRLIAQAAQDFAAGRLPDAAALLWKAVRADPTAAVVHSNLAVILEQLGQPDDALAASRRALVLAPDQPDAYYNMGIALSTLGRKGDAATAYRRAITLNPFDAEALSNLGGLLSEDGDADEAIAVCRRAIALDDRQASAHANLGAALKSKGQIDEAIAACRRAVALAPTLAKAHADLGAALLMQGKPEEAIDCCRTAIETTPGLLEAYLYLGAAFFSVGRLHNARVCCDYVLGVNPSYAEALYNRGNALQDQGRSDDAIACYQRALTVKPDYAHAHNNLQMQLHYSSRYSAAEILDHARTFARHIEPAKHPLHFANAPDPHRQLRIGYVSGDFRRHPVGYFLAPVLDNHDRTAVQIVCYSNNAHGDDMTDRLRRRSDQWRNIVGLSDAAAAALIATDGIDILIDLAGHTGLNRLALFASKPAPVQASWLGYWGTTGLAAMDYVLSDAVTVPPGEARWYGERVIRLPGGRFCYAPPDDAPIPAAEPPMRRNGHVTFGSFNNLAKLGPGVIALWAAVLRAVPSSRLLLKWASLADDEVRQRLRATFEAAGVEAERLELRAASPHAAMLAEYDDVDIALDPFPFSGGLTSCEALWMGLPVVTLPGSEAPSRQTLGFLQALDRAEWIAASPADYVEIAGALAADGDRLGLLRQTQRRRMADSSLCDGPTFTRGLEKAYREMWWGWCETQQRTASGETP
jgi:predicted O-linked N-acetylglucosamine transferase (SPINDLY family)